ncbi:hypothetical protein BOX15_Mlig002839g2, partial [Macrostomum lignano]
PCLMDYSQIIDVDWRLSVTAAGSDPSEVGRTSVVLSILLQKGGNASSSTCSSGERERVFLELSLTEFYDFLHQMEKAKGLLDMQGALD